MVLADGCFDPLHIGHVRYLEAAAEFGSPLIVRVASDAAIRAKGREPFQSQDEREQVLLALRVVDDICTHDTLAEAVEQLQPCYLVKGEDWRDSLPADVLEACKECGAIIEFTETLERTSSERLSA